MICTTKDLFYGYLRDIMSQTATLQLRQVTKEPSQTETVEHQS